MYTYVEDLSAPKKWFKANVDEILRSYVGSHSITKEELFLGTGNHLQPGLKHLPLFWQLLERLVHQSTLYLLATITPTARCVRIVGVVTEVLKLLKSGTL